MTRPASSHPFAHAPKPDFFGEMARLFALGQTNTRGVRLAEIALMTLAINILSLALPILAMQIYDRIIARGGVETLSLLTIGVIVALVAECCLRITRAYVTGWLGARREHWLYRTALSHCMHTDLRALNRATPAHMAQSFEAITKLREFYSGQAVIALIEMPFILVFAALMAYLGGIVAVLPVILIVAFALRAVYIGNRLKDVIDESDDADADRYQMISEILRGIHTIKSFSAENFMLRHYEARQHKAVRAHHDISVLAGQASDSGVLFAQAMTASLMIVGAYLSVGGTLSMGALIACVLLSGRMVQPIQRALSLWVRFQDLNVARERLNAVFAMPRIDAAAEAQVTPVYCEGRVRLEHVDFRHHVADASLLHHLSFELNPRDCVAIHGAPGCGKSSLLRIMAGLDRADAGRVIIDGVEVSRIPAQQLARHVGYLSTGAEIVQGTIAQNIRSYGRVGVTEMQEIMRLLLLDRDVAKLPMGLETKLENIPADPVPPGLKQRIGMARILALRPRTLLFDNADRALDRAGYNHIYRLLARIKGKAGLVIVSEDRNLLALADTHYVLENGKLARIGKVESPMAIKFYRELRA
jgi:ATP-binding cassette subfamily C protein LapB